MPTNDRVPSPQELASEIAEMLRTIREDQWPAFSEAARQDGSDPYEMLGRVVVKIVAEQLGHEIGEP